VYAARIFDEVIIRHDKDLRGRTREELTELIIEGINSLKPGLPVKVISDEKKAVEYARLNAKKGAFITVCTDSVGESIQYISEMQKEEMSQSGSFNQVLLKAS
jgi:cyanophycin synthetase